MNLKKLANKFEQILKQSSRTAAAGEIESVLKDGRIWGTPEVLFPLADAAGLPDNFKVQFQIVVNPDLSVSFRTNPPAHHQAVTKMLKLMKSEFGAKMQQILKTIPIKERDDSGKVISQRPVQVVNPVVVGWHSLK